MTYHLILRPDRYNTTSDRSNDWPNWMPLHKTQCYKTAAILCFYTPGKLTTLIGHLAGYVNNQNSKPKS